MEGPRGERDEELAKARAEAYAAGLYVAELRRQLEGQRVEIERLRAELAAAPPAAPPTLRERLRARTGRLRRRRR